MAVSIMCPNLRCRKILVVPVTARGKRVRCFYCGQVLRIPEQRGGAARAAATVPEDAGEIDNAKKKRRKNG